MQALKKVGRKGKREERETHSFSHFPFRFHFPPPPPPSPPFFCACHPGYFEVGAAEGYMIVVIIAMVLAM